MGLVNGIMNSEQLKTRVRLLATMIAHTEDEECDCDQVYSVMDQLVELHTAGVDIAAHIPMMQRHLEMCHCCHAEYEALQLILAESTAA